MQTNVALAFAVNFVLILGTLLMLVQPEFVFRGFRDKSRFLVRTAGMFMLCLTFCWSFVLGCLITIVRLQISI